MCTINCDDCGIDLTEGDCGYCPTCVNERVRDREFSKQHPEYHEPIEFIPMKLSIRCSNCEYEITDLDEVIQGADFVVSHRNCALRRVSK